MPTTDTLAVPPLLRRIKSHQQKADTTAKATVADTIKTKTKSILEWKAPKAFKLTEVKFAQESYFKGNPYYRPELGMHHSGILGDPAPYSVSNDNMVAGTLLLCFALAMIAASMSSNFITRQIKELFHRPYRRTNVGETAREVRFQLFLVLQTSLLLSITYYLFTGSSAGEKYIIDSPILIVAIFLAIFLSYFFAKNLLYTLVNWVYFDRKSNQQWSRLGLFLISAEGVLIFPAVLLLIYFGLPVQYTLFYIATVIVFAKLLLFYQGYVIFFKRTAASLQIILYFCTLELMPLMALLGILVYTDNYLTINY